MIPYFHYIDSPFSFEQNVTLQSYCDQEFTAYETRNGGYDGNMCLDMNLEWATKVFPLECYTMFVHQPAFQKVKPHTDNPKWKRNTVLIIPLRGYAKTHFTDGPICEWVKPALFNTQKEHWLENGSVDRYNFQVCFKEPIEEVVKCLTNQ